MGRGGFSRHKRLVCTTRKEVRTLTNSARDELKALLKNITAIESAVKLQKKMNRKEKLAKAA